MRSSKHPVYLHFGWALRFLVLVLLCGMPADAQYSLCTANLHVHSNVSGYDHGSLPSPESICSIADGWGLDAVGFS